MSEYVDVSVGTIDYKEFDEYLNNKIFVVQEICQTKKSHKQCLKKLYLYMKQGFEREEVRRHPLHFKFTTDVSEPIEEMQVRHFIINLMLWSAFIRYDRVHELNRSQIYDCTNITEDSLIGYINEHLIRPYQAIIDNTEISKALDDCIHHLSKIYIDFALMMGLTMDMETFIDLRNTYPRFEALINTKPKEGMQPKEIEEMIDTNLQEYLDIIIRQDTKNNLRPFVVTGVGVNRGQLAQFSIMDGLKPDIEGNVTPIPIDSNFINGGLNSISNFYIDGQAGSKPLILNKTVMGKSGYFSYKTMTLSANYRLSQHTEDCHSKRPIKYLVETKKHLKKIHNRYYYDDIGDLHRVDGIHDTHLLGKTILLRDPVTCCSKDGICHICYGDLWYSNNDPLFHAGRFAATQINEPIQQKILSSKHMLRTESDMIKFNPEFDRFFVLDTNKININMDTVENLNDWKFFIANEDLYYMDELAGNEDFNVYIEKFTLWNKRTKESILFHEEGNRDMYFFASTFSMLKKDTIDGVSGKSLYLSKLDGEDALCVINVVNNELSTVLKNIIKLLDRKDHYGCRTIDDMVNTLVQLTIDSGMSVDAVHSSMLIKGLIRSKDNILVAPDFMDENLTDDDYQMLSVSNALIYNPSLAVSFAFDNVNKQIINPVTYNKYKPSDYDIFFKENIYNDSVDYYANRKRNKQERYRQMLLEEYRKKKKKK